MAKCRLLYDPKRHKFITICLAHLVYVARRGLADKYELMFGKEYQEIQDDKDREARDWIEAYDVEREA